MQIDQGHEAAKRGDVGGRSLLLEIPNEILQYTASLLPTDGDVVNLATVCKELNARILSSSSTTWRYRFADKYDMPQGRTSQELSWEYQTRAIVLPQKIDFKKKENEQQELWIEVVQTMLTEVLTLLPPGNGSKTLEKIRETVTGVNFLSTAKRENPSETFCAVQLCLTAYALDPMITDCCLRTDYDIGAVYAYGSELNGPFIEHEELDLQPFLHMRNFWQRHLLNMHEETFFESFSQLPLDLKPKLLRRHDANSTGLGNSWIGYYSCVHPLPDSVEELQHRQTCADLDSHLDQVDIMVLEFRNGSNDPFWPSECNDIIPQCRGLNKDRTYFDGVQKYHGASDATHPLFGFTEPIATPYGGFSGWMRICFAICEQPEDGAGAGMSPSLWIHGYEALIIPGGRLMLGRWLDLKDTSGRGPFIFWDL